MTSASGIVLTLDPLYSTLKDFLIETTGLTYYKDRDGDLVFCVSRRLSQLGLCDCRSYLELLRDSVRGASELELLVAEIAIGETYFFRHEEQFDALRHLVLPAILEKNKGSRRLRVWSAGCANGAELYSVAILLRNELAQELVGWQVSLLGTDINHDALRQARGAKFEEWALRDTPESLKLSCFMMSGKSWTLAAKYRQSVSFQYHNLVTDPFPSQPNGIADFDLILCRNVMIYFSHQVMRRIAGQFRACLVDEGWLIVGHAELNIEIFRDFQIVNTGACTMYRKGGISPEKIHAAPAPIPAPAMDAPAVEIPTVLVLPAKAPPADSRELALTAESGLAQGIELRPCLEDHDGGAGVCEESLEATALPCYRITELRLLADRGDWARAVQHCERMLREDGLNARVHYYHALILGQADLSIEKERALRRAVYLDRKFVLAHYHLGLHLKQGHPRQAARCFENVLDLCAPLQDGQVFADGDGITAAELRELAQTQIDVLRRL